MDNNSYLYPNLATVRKSLYTQNQISELLGITQQEISRYETGETKAPINYIIDIAELCHVSVDYILGRKPETTDMLSDEESELISTYRELSPTNKIRVSERAKTLYEEQNDKK
ncbi:MAG: helix-turn-helix transcriptional regulator [Firmicutes bacterium]|nr:helix-turn-helix transcriptional regulator [Bacillota bacterium]